MKYKRFKIENYKGIRTVTIDLANNRILTLVGLNESGKTTILEAIHRFQDLMKGTQPSEKMLKEIRPKGIDFSGEILLEAEVELEEEDKEAIRNFHREENGKRTELEIPDTFVYTLRFVYKTHEYQKTEKTYRFPLKTTTSKALLLKSDKDYCNKIIQFIKKELMPEILFYEDFIFEIPEKIRFVKGNPESHTEEKAQLDGDKKNLQWQKVLDDILTTVNTDFSSFQRDVAQIWDDDNDLARNRLATMEQQLNEKITQGWKELFKRNGEEQQDTKLNFKEIRLESTPQGNYLEVSFKVKNDSGKEFKIHERSKGFNWFFSFLIFTEFRKNRSKNILFLLDEPASNLHSSAQSKILEAIEQLSDQAMVIYSTHSHHLIEPLWLNGAYVIVNDSISQEKLVGEFTDENIAHKITAEKYYKHVSDSQLQTNTVFFQPILDKLMYQPSPVEPIPPITITEGKYDWYTYKYLAEIILKDEYAFGFYPGPGCSQHENIIRLYLSWGKHFVLLLDSDGAGVEAKDTYLKEFEGFVEDKIFTYQDVFQNNVVTEDLIDESDKRLICDTAFESGTYDLVKDNPAQLKSKLNFGIIQLLTQKKEIALSEATKKNFEKLFDFIKEHHGTK